MMMRFLFMKRAAAADADADADADMVLDDECRELATLAR
jgi:hypothetical protein